jgi:cytidylate kinase
MVIAVDGPAGAGKSTVCRLLAESLGYAYLDTGAMFRALAWCLSEQGFTVADQPPSSDLLASLPLHFATEESRLTIRCRGRLLDSELRQPQIAERASRISQHPGVRSYLLEAQRHLAKTGDIVVEGRDTTTVVFPDSPCKVFLTADLATRTRRRLLEHQGQDIAVDYPTLEAQIQARDRADAERSLAPLKPAPDALVLDTSGLDIDQVVERLKEYVGQGAAGHGQDSRLT